MEFLKLWRIFVRRKILIIVSALIFFVCVAALTNIIHPTYKATAKLLVDTSGAHASLITVLGLQDNKSITDNTGHNTDIALITLRPLLEHVIASFNLKSRWGVAIKPEKLIKWGIVNKFWPQPYINVEHIEDADMVRIQATSGKAEEAMQMANELAELYVSSTVERIHEEYGAVRRSLEDQVALVEKEYSDALKQLRDFRIAKVALDVGEEGQKAADLQSQLDQLKLSLAARSIDVSKEHPDYQALQKQIDTVSALIAQQAVALPAKQAEYSKLSLRLTVCSDTYQRLLSYRTMVGLAESVTLSNTRLVERAITPTEKDFPKKPLMYVIGMILAVFFGFGLGTFVDYVDNAVQAERKEAIRSEK